MNFPMSIHVADVQALAMSLLLSDQIAENILRANVELSSSELVRYRANLDLVFSAERAVQCKMARMVGDFAPPEGTSLYPI
jgi:hypothetical protein